MADLPQNAELRAQGLDPDDRLLFLSVVGALLTAHGIGPCDADPGFDGLEFILPAGWRDLPIVRAMIEARGAS